ncbi:hypothetical protein Gotri_019817 [Gossypium trilobum]|uniref:NB-ARC domain-containing protein n=1 Tax=Gossypium trilobum TaxID=34281 RepID=A0A7J9EE74_9ROSI|nr:hypothetical protein [Gossypium trilobum]
MDAKKNFPIGVLEHEEAWHFFNKIVGDGVESSDLLPIATEVAKKCGGLPIAIRTLATFLKNEPPFVWEDALRQLMVSHLKASYLLLDGCTNLVFDMHDLISDVAKSIASKGNPVFDLRRKHDLNDWPNDETMKECDKIVCIGMSELPDQLKCPKLTFL